jgi:hypothetical protein
MPRVDPEALADRRLVRVYIALKIREARQVEGVLDQHGVEFAVLVEPAGRSLFGSARQGAVFCVAEEHSVRCVELLTRAGFDVGVVPQTPDEDDVSPA